MNLNLRPMSEAPIGVPLLVKWKSLEISDFEWSVAGFKREGEAARYQNAIGFYLLADVLAAVELLRKMTPEGYEFTGEYRVPELNEWNMWFPGSASRLIDGAVGGAKYPILRKLPDPVEYEYVAEAEPRAPKTGDWFLSSDQKWTQAKMDFEGNSYICARRVEVKR